jgi:hypothetical protein
MAAESLGGMKNRVIAMVFFDVMRANPTGTNIKYKR